MRILVSCVVVLLAAAIFHPAHGQLRPEVEQFRDRIASLEGESWVPPRLSPSLGVTLVSVPSGIYVYGSRHDTGSEKTEATGGNIAAGLGAYIGGGLVGWALLRTVVPKDTSKAGSTSRTYFFISTIHLFGGLATGLTVYHGRGKQGDPLQTVGGAIVFPLITTTSGALLGGFFKGLGLEGVADFWFHLAAMSAVTSPLLASQGANYMYTNSQ
jgi:hypothetical protein